MLFRSIPSSNEFHSYYKYYIFLKSEELKKNWSRRIIIETLNKLQIPCDTGTCPEIYMEKAFGNYFYRIVGDEDNGSLDSTNKKDGLRLPDAKNMGERSMVFLVHPTLDMNSIHYVIDTLKQVMKKACR